MKLGDKIKNDKLVEVGSLPENSYFAVVGRYNFGEVTIKTSFLFDGKRFTRLWDGVFVDSFFTGSDSTKKVLPVNHKEAVDLAKQYRKV